MARDDRERDHREAADAAGASTEPVFAGPPSWLSRIGAVSTYCAPVFLALFTFGYLLRGGTLLFGVVNLTLVFLLATVLCVSVRLLATRELVFQLSWADLGMTGLAVLLVANSSSGAGVEKGLRFVALVLAPYFLARVIFVDAQQVRRFLATTLAAATVIGIGALAFLTLPDSVSGLLPYMRTEWDQRVTFMQANPVQVGIFLMVGILLYTGLMPGWRRIWIAPSLAVIGALLYVLLYIGTRGSLLALAGASAAAVVIALGARWFRTAWAPAALFAAMAVILYPAFAPSPAETELADAAEATAPAAAETPETEPAGDEAAEAAPAEAEPDVAEEAADPPPPADADTAADAVEDDEAIIALPEISLPNAERLETLAALGSLEEMAAEPTMSLRMQLYTEALTKFREGPLLGAGTASMDDYAHNIFLETAAETGLVGLVFLFTVLVFALRSLWKFYIKTDERDPCLHIATAAFLVVGGLFFQKQFSTALSHHKDLAVFLAILFNLPLLLRTSVPAAAPGLRGRVPPRFHFLVPDADVVPMDRRGAAAPAAPPELAAAPETGAGR